MTTALYSQSLEKQTKFPAISSVAKTLDRLGCNVADNVVDQLHLVVGEVVGIDLCLLKEVTERAQ